MYKLAIVDDEAIMRKGLRNLIDWAHFDCQIVCEASDGQELLDLFASVQPDIVITDIKMPRMDGLELCRRLHTQFPQVQVIMLTAYSDFEYARQAMRYGVTEYVTKSGGMQEVTRAVQHSIELLEEQRRLISRQEVQAKSLETMRSSYFKNVFTGVLHGDDALNSRAASLELPLDSFAVMYLETAALDAEQPETPGFGPLIDFLYLAFQDMQQFWCFPLEKDLFAAVIAHTSQEFPYERVVQHCQEVLNVLHNMYSGNIFIGISSAVSGPSALPLACKQAKEALGRRFLDDSSQIYLYQDQSRRSTGASDVINRAIEDLFESVSSGNETRTACCLKALFDAQKASNIPAEMLKSQALVLNERCSRLLAERKIYRENIYEHDVTFFQKITACRFMSEYKQLVSLLVQDTCRQMAKGLPTAADPVQQAKKYIADHCCDGITLESVADALHISPSHLARLYKDATGSTVKADINILRLERAKQILQMPGATVQAAADAIGMDDLTYFSHFFKKHTHMTPRQYQAQFFSNLHV